MTDSWIWGLHLSRLFVWEVSGHEKDAARRTVASFIHRGSSVPDIRNISSEKISRAPGNAGLYVPRKRDILLLDQYVSI